MRNHIVRVFFLSAVMAVTSPFVCRAQLSVRTNVLWDVAASEPNVGVEVPVGDHVSVGANFGLKAWPRYFAWDWDNKENPTHWRNFAIVPEVRYYLDQVYEGFFTGADFVYSHYNVGDVGFPQTVYYPDAKDYRVQGSFWGAGPFAGYAWWPWENWRLELEAGLAVGLSAYGRYDCRHCGTKLADEYKVGLAPKLAVNVAYNPVGRSERKPKYQYIAAGTDTITVMTPPVAFVVHLKDVASPETEGDRLAREYSWVQPIQNYRPLDYQTRPGRDSIQYVRFPLNSWELKRDMEPNAQVLDRLEDAVSRIKEEVRTSEMLISIVGLASIEGPQDRNDTLSIRRAKAVAQYLMERTGLERRYFETIGKGEAWDWFKAQLEAIPDGDEDLSAQQVQKLLDIIGSQPDPDVRERLIRADSKLYATVKDKLLEDQRSSGYISVYYNNAPDPVTEKYNKQVLPLLKAKRYHDAVRVFKADEDLAARAAADAEAANAYGIALYFVALDNKDTEAEAEAQEWVRQAAQNGSEAARQNLEGMKEYGPARKEYEAWQEAMK